jgi:patatin-like phospholipase/acyl hydrolase
MYNFWAAPNFNTWAVPVITGIIVAVISSILVNLFKKYLENSEATHDLRNKVVMTSLEGIDKKLTMFCAQNHEEHEKLDDKIVNHDHEPVTGRPRFYT